MSRPLSFLLLLCALPASASAAPPRFTVRDAILAEWARQPIALDDKARAQLPAADRARLERAERRIGVPGTPSLLPPELDKPDVATWEALAKKAQPPRTPEERFTALHFLNRLKSMNALSALAGLTAADAKGWPKHLHLDAHVATARARGEVVSPELAAFLAALPVDPVRAQAARLRLVLEGKEKELLPALPPTPGNVLALLDAWNKGPWEAREADHLALLDALFTGLSQSDLRALAGLKRRRAAWSRLGLQLPGAAQLRASREAAILRLLDGIPAAEVTGGLVVTYNPRLPSIVVDGFFAQQLRMAHEGLVEKFRSVGGKTAPGSNIGAALPPPLTWEAAAKSPDVLDRVRYLATVPSLGDNVEAAEAIVSRVFADTEIDSLQALIEAFDRLKVEPTARRRWLTRFLAHPTWIARYEAWKVLSALDEAAGPKTPWPKAPSPTTDEQAILDEAVRLAEAGKRVRLQLTLQGNRTIVLKLDPLNAPINVANLVLLAKKGFFNGRRVPRVVPDFVVQMGSPLDTMDGGPGYSVRCEDSLDWYGPGSVGMALSGKDTGGCQFFITTNATPHLTGKYTRVGRVEWPTYVLPMLDDLSVGVRILRAEVLPQAK